MFHFVRWCFGLELATTQTTDRERECLANYSKGRKRLVEIGVWEGYTARILRQSMDHDAVYFAVDPYPVGRLLFSTQQIIAHRTVNPIKNGSIVWIRDTGVAASQYPEVLEEPIDFIFVDGDHSYEGLKSDWFAWSKLVAKGGIVALHDSRSMPNRCIDDAGSVRFTKDVVHNDARFELLHEVDSLTVLRRKFL